MRMPRRGLGAASLLGAMILVGTGSVGMVTANASSVSPAPVTLSCGSVVTQDTTLGNDLGPCPGDGLLIRGSNITVDLGGHTITGASAVQEAGDGTTAPSEQVGVQLMGVSGVILTNGIVQDFDAGVAVGGGSANTIENITAVDSVNDNVSPGIPTSCNYGDGITTSNSNSNLIQNNTVDHNGPYSGISLVGASGRNTVKNNVVENNDIPNKDPAGVATTCGGGGAMGTGRPVQDIGIRIEGPGATNNTVENNEVTDSALAGIAAFGNVCGTALTMPTTQPNTNNSILDNHVSGSGAATHTLDPNANGIALLRQGPLKTVCVSYDDTISGNTVTSNWNDGIFVGGPTHGNTINDNAVDSNGSDGIHLDGPVTGGGGVVFGGAVDNTLIGNKGQGNAEFDGADYNPYCANNVWKRDRFGTVNQPCVAGAGGTGKVTKGGKGTVEQVVVTGASGSSPAKTLTTTWSAPVQVVAPAGFTVYADSGCLVKAATGQGTVSGNGTMTPTVSLSAIPPPGTDYFEVAPSSVTTSAGVSNGAVPCTAVSFAS